MLGYLLVMLVLRKVSWRVPVAFTLAAAAPLGGYLVWYHDTHGVYAFDQVGGRALYSRVMSVADCERLDLTDRQRLLCVPEPPSQRPEAPDHWGWSPDSPVNKYFPTTDDDPFLREFGLTVIRFPERPNTPCYAAFYTPTPTLPDPPEFVPQPGTPLRSALAAYSEVVAASRGPMLGVGSVAFGMYEPRYGVTSVLLFPLATAIALHGPAAPLGHRSRRPARARALTSHRAAP